ncbi:RmlC-like cupin domain-containing protein [Paraphoma chrysanthemicola]|uniref:RmlC-like cupin domain-containing protein n=1 Tax=Paraphoma chrysanthemicola TaxID=798071 RepID=A0A8K0QV89_9PLEO|nr:RmlC-like cupin domain-containing protein [Paraphoma chrysanthemicola]
MSNERLCPYFKLGRHTQESTSTQTVIDALELEKHIEGGYFAEIDRDLRTVPNPFLDAHDGPTTTAQPFSGDNNIRNASTSIYYLLTPVSPQGHFHRNKGRTVHTAIEGRGRYVLIHADEEGTEKRVESFIVGKDVSRGEKPVWIVEGGKYKASFLLPIGGGQEESDRLLISETVVPGFEYSDHDFLPLDKFKKLVTVEQSAELQWLVRTE